MSIKTLITADDFGFTSNINKAIIEAYEKGRVTELSLMVDRIFSFHYGSPKEIYQAYRKDIEAAKHEGAVQSIEVLFHPGYSGEFEKD